jgi:hypothetical protein
MQYYLHKDDFWIIVRKRNKDVSVYLMRDNYPNLAYIFGLGQTGPLFMFIDNVWKPLDPDKIIDTTERHHKVDLDWSLDTLVQSLKKLSIKGRMMMLSVSERTLIGSLVYDLVMNEPLDWLPPSKVYKLTGSHVEMDNKTRLYYSEFYEGDIREHFIEQIQRKKKNVKIPMKIIPAAVPTRLTLPGKSTKSPPTPVTFESIQTKIPGESLAARIKRKRKMEEEQRRKEEEEFTLVVNDTEIEEDEDSEIDNDAETEEESHDDSDMDDIDMDDDVFDTMEASTVDEDGETIEEESSEASFDESFLDIEKETGNTNETYNNMLVALN